MSESTAKKQSTMQSTMRRSPAGPWPGPGWYMPPLHLRHSAAAITVPFLPASLWGIAACFFSSPETLLCLSTRRGVVEAGGKREWSLLDIVNYCNSHDPNGFIPVFAGKKRVGYIGKSMAGELFADPGYGTDFWVALDSCSIKTGQLMGGFLYLAPSANTVEERTEVVQMLVKRLRATGAMREMAGAGSEEGGMVEVSEIMRPRSVPVFCVAWRVLRVAWRVLLSLSGLRVLPPACPSACPAPNMFPPSALRASDPTFLSPRSPRSPQNDVSAGRVPP